MNDQQLTPMRKLILTGTYAQYRDWLALHNANPRAALYIHRGEQFQHLDPEESEIVLADGYRDNPAYMSAEYIAFRYEQGPAMRLAS